MKRSIYKKRNHNQFVDLKLIVLFIVFIITFLFALAVNFLYQERVSFEDKIFATIAEANYCDTAADCQNVGSVCPFGCDIFVNTAEAERVSAILDTYQSTCQYQCVELKSVSCIENKCVAEH